MLQIAVIISFALLTGALILTFFRIAGGPTFPDRVLTLDLLSAIVIGFIGIYAISSGVTDFIDVAMVMALMGFLGTVGFARFIEYGGNEK